MAERRRMVFHLSAVRGLTAAEIAEVAGVSKRTVERDLRAARRRAMDELRERAETAESVTDLALDIDAALSAVAREAWVSVAASQPAAAQRVRALNTALAAVARRADVLQSLGLLKKLPDQLDVNFDPLRMSDQEIQHELSKLREAQNTKQQRSPTRAGSAVSGGTAAPEGGSPGLDRTAPVHQNEGGAD